MTSVLTIQSDRDLVTATRSGSDAAWDELAARHRPALVVMARALKLAGAKHRVDEALRELRSEIHDGSFDIDGVGPGAAELRGVCCRSIGAMTGRSVGPAPAPLNQRSDEFRRTEQPDRADLVAIASAFVQSTWAWQTVLWHGRAEGRSAVEIGPLLGRSGREVAALQQRAEEGLFEQYLRADAAQIPDLDSTSLALFPLIGGYRRGVLPPVDRRRVDELMQRRTPGSADGLHAARWLAVSQSFGAMVPPALVPGLVGVTPDRLWALLGVGTAAVGAAGLAEARSERVRRLARIGAVAAIVLAVLGAAFLIRSPFDELDASLIPGRSPTTTGVGTGGDATDGSTSGGGAVTTPGGADDVNGVPNRIELVFPGARQGAVYVPGQELLDLSIVLSADSAFVAGGTGTVGAAITNNDNDDARVTFEIRATNGIGFDAGGDGAATCRSAGADPASCSFDLRAGSTTSLSLVFSLPADLSGQLTVVPSIPGAPLDVEID